MDNVDGLETLCSVARVNGSNREGAGMGEQMQEISALLPGVKFS